MIKPLMYCTRAESDATARQLDEVIGARVQRNS